jgi:hypothetical protein
VSAIEVLRVELDEVIQRHVEAIAHDEHATPMADAWVVVVQCSDAGSDATSYMTRLRGPGTSYLEMQGLLFEALHNADFEERD